MNKKTIYFLAIAVVVIIVLAVFISFGKDTKSLIQTPVSLKTEVQVNNPTTQVSVNTPTIVQAVMSRSINVKGNVGVSTFNAKTDKIIYAVLTLKNITKNTKLSYIRNLNGKYVDSKVAVISKDGITNFYFAFEKGIGNYPVGSYTLNLYVNGARSQSINYFFK